MPTIDLNKAREITSQKEEQYGLPPGTLFKVAGIESQFDSTVVSKKGARSYFQFMPDTAKNFGVKYGDFASEADGAARYISSSVKKYGSLDAALVEYNGGPNAVSAFQAGKPWRDSQDYLNKFYGTKSYVPLSSQFTTAKMDMGGLSASEFSLATSKAKDDAEYGGVWNNVANTPRAFALGFKENNSVYNWWQERGLEHVDPNFQWNDENSKAALEGIPQDNWEYILQAKSAREAEARRARALESLKNQQELGKMGVAGVAGNLTSGLIDLPTLLMFVPGVGGEGLLTVGSRIGNAIKMGLVGAATNAAFEAATYKNRPLGTHEDIYAAAAAGFGLAALGGFMAKPGMVRTAEGVLADENVSMYRFGMRESAKAQLDEFKAHGLELTPEGKALYDDTLKEKVSTGTPAKASEIFDRHVEDVKLAREREGVIPPKEGDVTTAKVRAEEANIPLFERTNMETRAPKGPLKATSDFLTALKSSGDEMISSVATRLSEQLRNDTPVVMRREGFRSYYDPGKNEIHLAKNADEWVQLHEITHAVTANKIRYGLDNPNTAHGALVQELKDVFEVAKTAAKSETFADHRSKYYLKNLDEFVAGIYSGKSEFLDFLSRTKVEGTPLLTRIVDTFRRLLGMDPEQTNALTKALSAMDRLIDEPMQMKQTLVSKESGSRRTLKYLMEPGKEADALAASEADVPPVFGLGLGLEHRLGGEKIPQSVRNLASKLFGTTVGYKGHSVVRANAWDDTVKMAEGWAVSMRKEAYPAFEEWFKASGRPRMEKRGAWEEFGTQVSNYIRGFDGDYPKEVQRAGEVVRKTLANVVDYINNPLHAEGGSKRGLTMQEVRDPETGTVTLVGGLDKNPNYLPRKHDINKWNTLVQTYGRDAVEGWWSRAYQAARPEVSEEAAARFGKWYVRTVEEAHANRTGDLLTDMLRGQDKEALKFSLIENGGYSEAEAMKVMEDLFPTKATDTGRTMSSLKHRNTISENYTETWTMPDGTKAEVGLNDFVHSNAFELVEPYLRRTAGSVSMAKHLDVYKVSDIDRIIAEATENKLGQEFRAKPEIDSMRKNLKFAFDRIQGVPIEDFTWWRKGLQMWRDFNVIRLMGGTVWNQATEASQIVGTMGWKSVTQAIPELKQLSRDIKTGKVPNDILDHLENTIGGVGSEYVARMEFGAKDDWVRNLGDTNMNRWLDKIDTGLGKFSKGVLEYTGMTPLMIQQKRVHAVALVNHFVNQANGKIKSTFLTPERLAWMGLDEEAAGKLMADLKKFSKPTKGEYSDTFKLDIKAFAKEAPESHSAFMNAIHRESRRVIQENDLASMVPLMGTTLGKTVFQFQNFSIHGWNKSLMFAMNHRDWSTLSTVLHGSLFASLSYMGRTMVGSIGMDPAEQQKYLDKRMNTQQIVANSFGRISQMSLLPNIYDTLSPYPMFTGMRTTSDISSLAANPTLQAVNGLISMKNIVRNSLSDEYQTTKKDIRTWGRLLPLNNVAPISTLLNSLANDFPSSEKEN